MQDHLYILLLPSTVFRIRIRINLRIRIRTRPALHLVLEEREAVHNVPVALDLADVSTLGVEHDHAFVAVAKVELVTVQLTAVTDYSAVGYLTGRYIHIPVFP